MHSTDWCNPPDSDRNARKVWKAVRWSKESTLKMQEFFAIYEHSDFEMIKKYVKDGGDVKEQSDALQGSSPLEIILR